MIDFKVGNLVRLRSKILEGSYLHGVVGLVVAILWTETVYRKIYYKILFGEEIFAFRADEIELL